MLKTRLEVKGRSFLINGKPTYSEIPGGNPSAQGLLMNARFIQGVFDDAADPGRFARYGFDRWDPEDHTDRLIAALPEWYAYGLRAFTVGFQGGGPCFTIDNTTIQNNPFGTDGKKLDGAYAARMDRLIRGADAAGMVVIVSYFYGEQVKRIPDGQGVRNAVTTASRFLKDGGYKNVIIEVANEYDISPFAAHPIIRNPDGMAMLIDLARRESGGLPVGSSGGGGSRHKEVVEASDVVLVHGNHQSRQHYYNMIRDCRTWAPDKPIVCNEDSQAIGNMLVCKHTDTSWGYYNNMTKQEPPVRWEVLPGEDRFFALRMADMVGIKKDHPAFDDQYYLQGFEPAMTYGGNRWIRVASLFPESIDYVEFFRSGSLHYTCYDEPFSVEFLSNWRQGGTAVERGEKWEAKIHLRDGRTIAKQAVCS
jgi:hypothetical protein